MTPDATPTSQEAASVGDAAAVHELSIEELLAHEATAALSRHSLTAPTRVHLAITNKDALGEASEQRRQLQKQARAEGYDEDAIPDVLDRLAPLPEPDYRLTLDAAEGDFVLVHGGDAVTHRELARYGLKPADLTAFLEESAS